MEDVETFEAGNEGTCGTLAERIGEGTGEAGVPHEVVAVHRLVAIAATLKLFLCIFFGHLENFYYLCIIKPKIDV